MRKITLSIILRASWHCLRHSTVSICLALTANSTSLFVHCLLSECRWGQYSLFLELTLDYLLSAKPCTNAKHQTWENKSWFLLHCNMFYWSRSHMQECLAPLAHVAPEASFNSYFSFVMCNKLEYYSLTKMQHTQKENNQISKYQVC